MVCFIFQHPVEPEAPVVHDEAPSRVGAWRDRAESVPNRGPVSFDSRSFLYSPLYIQDSRDRQLYYFIGGALGGLS
jgi:hypothetical protein